MCHGTELGFLTHCGAWGCTPEPWSLSEGVRKDILHHWEGFRLGKVHVSGLCSGLDAQKGGIILWEDLSNSYLEGEKMRTGESCYGKEVAVTNVDQDRWLCSHFRGLTKFKLLSIRRHSYGVILCLPWSSIIQELSDLSLAFYGIVYVWQESMT